MKMYSGVLEKVRKTEYKKGINYARVGGSLYNFFKVGLILSFIYAMGIKFIYFSGAVLVPENNIPVLNPAICTALLVAGFVLILCRVQIVGAPLIIAPAVFLNVSFAGILKDDLTDKILPKFFWAHLIPLGLLCLFAIALTVIAVKEKLKTRQMYLKVTDSLYATFKETAENPNEIDENAWNEFLKNYTPEMDKELTSQKGKPKKSEE